MAGKIFVNDNAGVFVRLIDKSQRPSEPRSKEMSGAFAINAERGLMNTIYYVQGKEDVPKYFGKKNWRKYGKSMYDLDRYLEGGHPAYVVRVGQQDANGNVDATTEKLSYVDIHLTDKCIDIQSSPDSEDGCAYADIKDALDTNAKLCRIFAKGEGDWGDKITLIIEQRAGVGANNTAVPPTATNFPADVRIAGDGPRRFSLRIKCEGEKDEYYEEVSFHPADTGKVGSIYIVNVLANSNYVGVVVNETLDPESAGFYVLPATPNSGGRYQFEKKLCGGTNTPLDCPNGMVKCPNSSEFANGLRRIFENYLETDPWLAFNAGQEIDNTEFNALFGDPLKEPGKTDRCLGLTSVPEIDATTIPTGRDGVNSMWVAKWFQWLKGYDSDTKMDVMTSPIGWVGRTIAREEKNGHGMLAPAGYRRGIVEDVKDISRIVKAEERVKVVGFQWNPIKKDHEEYVLWDALTSQPLESSFSNIHVVLSFQRIRRDIEDRLKTFSFEFNDESTVGTMLGILRNMADLYMSQGYAEEIIVDDSENVYGTDQIKINWNVRFKEAARTIVVDVIAYRSDQSLSVSMGE